MLKTIFIGSKNDFNQMLVHWLNQHSELTGVVWIQATAWKKTWKGRWRFAQKRLHRYGLLKTINETLFFLYYNTVKRRELHQQLHHLIDTCWAQDEVERWSGDAIFAESVNAPEVQAFIGARQPDLAFAMCINEFFGMELRSIPRLGVFLWHEGITPEYKGLYSPFWAVHNLEFDKIGYTLLCMNDKYDAGEIYVQGAARDVDPHQHHYLYLGHKAILDSLPAVESFLKESESGTAKPLERPEAQTGYYTYPGITDLFRQIRRLKRFRQTAEG